MLKERHITWKVWPSGVIADVIEGLGIMAGAVIN
jgi:hypothetical protein